MKRWLNQLYFRLQSLCMRRPWSIRAFFSAKNILYPARRRRLAALLRRYDIGAGDIVLDCGANVGNVTDVLLASGATVYAFEPNPHVFPVLQGRFGRHGARVTCIPKGVWTEAGSQRMYHDPRCAEDPARWGVSSSLVGAKKNVDRDCHSDVELVDLNEFVRGLGGRVKLLKLDVEGVEFELINGLIERGGIECVDFVVAETHEASVPDHGGERAKLLKRIADNPGLRSKINLEWV